MPTRYAETMPYLSLLLAAFTSLGASDAPAPTPAHAEVAAAERAFAAQARAQGTHAAFTAWLAPDSRVLNPAPDLGLPQHQGKAENGSLLAWGPAHIEVAARGDLALSTGPWTWHPTPAAPAAAQGHFVSIWQRQPDGGWKVLVDGGTPHAAAPAPDLTFTPPPAQAPKALDSASLGAAEARFERTFTTQGEAAALREAGATDLRLYRRGQVPRVGLAEGLKDLADPPAPATWKVVMSGASLGGDLGYTVGTAARTAGASSFFRVWRNAGGQWRLILDLQLPLPPEAPR